MCVCVCVFNFKLWDVSIFVNYLQVPCNRCDIINQSAWILFRCTAMLSKLFILGPLLYKELEFITIWMCLNFCVLLDGVRILCFATTCATYRSIRVYNTFFPKWCHPRVIIDNQLLLSVYVIDIYRSSLILFFMLKMSLFFPLIIQTPNYKGVRCGAVSWGTALQSGRSRVHFPLASLEFFIDIILPVALWPWGRLSL